ncbi:MAG TPA: ABC transporter substrate-binding protein [Candidatus Saccharimonadales bacterium]|nr:ABC transporter substrate-binding protein [Candidatus Saccharimonadales bacterium]
MDDRGFDNEGGNRPNIDDISPARPVEPISPRPQLSEQRFEPLRPPQPQTPPQPQSDSPPEPPETPLNRPDVPQVISNNEKPKKRWPKWLIGLIVIALIVVGGWYFFLKDKSENNGAASQTKQSKDIPLLRVGMWDVSFGKLYPDLNTNEYSVMVNVQIFEGLVRYEQKNKIVPNLATDWTNPDNKTWVFTINTKIKFHDGHTLTPADVKYSLDKVIAAKSDLTDTFASTIASVSTEGSNKVKIVTKTPDPTLLNKLASLYIIDDNLPKGDEPSQAGTGPYEVKPGTVPGSKEVQLVAFDGYHKGRPSTRALEFHSETTEKTLMAAFKAGKYDIVGTISPDTIKKNPNYFEYISVEPDVLYITFNLSKKGPLQNKKVREAIRYALSPEDIAKARGSQITPLSQMIPESIPGYNPAITAYKQDVEKSKQLLKDAGYPKGFTLQYSSGDSSNANEEIAKELKNVGITLNIDEHKDFDEYIDYFLSGKPEMYIVDYTSDTLDGVDIYKTTIFSPYYDNADFNKLIDEASNTVDPAQRLKLLQDAALIIDRDIPTVPLSTQDNLWLMNKDYNIVQDMPNSYISTYFYKTQLK